MRIEVVETRPEHIEALKHSLREDDAREVVSLGVSVSDALGQSCALSFVCRTLLIDGQVGAIGGCAGSPLGGVGEIWLLTSHAVERAPIAFMKTARIELAKLLRLYPKLENYVAAEYVRACRFLERLGFELDAPQGYGPHAAQFRAFRMER